MDRETRGKVLEGYERIAFGSITDAVRLLFSEEVSPQTLRRMDLFNISEIKRPKGGGMEIKFFDRIRALQCLQELEATGEAPCGFFRALEQGAMAFEADEEGGPCS